MVDCSIPGDTVLQIDEELCVRTDESMQTNVNLEEVRRRDDQVTKSFQNRTISPRMQ